MFTNIYSRLQGVGVGGRGAFSIILGRDSIRLDCVEGKLTLNSLPLGSFREKRDRKRAIL